MIPEQLDDVMRRALQFQMMKLPGQGPMMHMGTLYLVNDLARAVSELRADRTPDPAQIRADALREAIWAAFIAGVGQGSDEATAYEWGTAPQQSRQQAFDDFMADWNEDSAYLRALLDTPLSPTAVDNSPAPDAGGKEGV